MVFDNRKICYLIQFLIIVPTLWLLATNRIPEDYKKFVLVLAVVLTFFYLYKVFGDMSEGLDQSQNVYHVKMFDSAPGYDKPRLVINRGDMVVWTNIGEIEHTISGDNDEFNSGYLKPGDSYSVRFDHQGEYNYFCMLHRGWMRGVVIVL